MTQSEFASAALVGSVQFVSRSSGMASEESELWSSGMASEEMCPNGTCCVVLRCDDRYEKNSQFDRALTIYLRLRRGDVFGLIETHDLFDNVRDKVWVESALPHTASTHVPLSSRAGNIEDMFSNRSSQMGHIVTASGISSPDQSFVCWVLLL